MTAQDLVTEKHPVLLHKDPLYEDYEDLGNHATEAMGETGLFL